MLVVNQVTTQVTAEDTRCPPDPVDEQPEGEWKGTRSRVGVALGSTWAYCVNTQLVMEFLTKELRKVRSGRDTYPTAILLVARGIPYNQKALCGLWNMFTRQT